MSSQDNFGSTTQHFQNYVHYALSILVGTIHQVTHAASSSGQKEGGSTKIERCKIPVLCLKYSCIYKKYNVYTFLPKNFFGQFYQSVKGTEASFFFFF